MRFRFDDDWKSDIFMNLVDRRSDKLNPVQLMNKDFKCIELDSLSQETGELLATYLAVEQRSIKNLFYKNDILYGKLRPYLRKYYKANFDGCCSSEIWVLNSKFINHDFLYHYIQTNNFNTLANISTGSKMPRADWNIISESELSYPSMEEMKKIGKFLNHIEERIKVQSKIIDKYESLENQIKDILLWKNAEGKKVKLSNILFEISDKSTIQNQHAILSSTVKGLFLQSEYFDKEIASSNNIGYKVVHKGDVIISPQNLWMGNITYNDKFDNGLVSPSYKIFQINSNYNSIYISYLLRTYRALYLYKCVSEQGASVVRRNLNLEAFNELIFTIPSIEYQNKVADILDGLKRQVFNEKRYLNQLNKQKQFLLNNLFV